MMQNTEVDAALQLYDEWAVSHVHNVEILEKYHCVLYGLSPAIRMLLQFSPRSSSTVFGIPYLEPNGATDGTRVSRYLNYLFHFRKNISTGCAIYSNELEYAIAFIDSDKPCEFARPTWVDQPIGMTNIDYIRMLCATDYSLQTSNPRVTLHNIRSIDEYLCGKVNHITLCQYEAFEIFPLFTPLKYNMFYRLLSKFWKELELYCYEMCIGNVVNFIAVVNSHEHYILDTYAGPAPVSQLGACMSMLSIDGLALPILELSYMLQHRILSSTSSKKLAVLIGECRQIMYISDECFETYDAKMRHFHIASQHPIAILPRGDMAVVLLKLFMRTLNFDFLNKCAPCVESMQDLSRKFEMIRRETNTEFDFDVYQVLIPAMFEPASLAIDGVHVRGLSIFSDEHIFGMLETKGITRRIAIFEIIKRHTDMQTIYSFGISPIEAYFCRRNFPEMLRATELLYAYLSAAPACAHAQIISSIFEPHADSNVFSPTCAIDRSDYIDIFEYLFFISEHFGIDANTLLYNLKFDPMQIGDYHMHISENMCIYDD